MSDTSIDMIMDIDNSISAITSLHTLQPIPPEVCCCKNLLDAIRFILQHNSYRRNYETLTEHQEQIFEIIEKLGQSPQDMFMYLRKYFAIHFDIDLYLIAFDNGKFSMINKDNYKKKTVAYLSFNEDNTVCGPLYTVDTNGTSRTVFSAKNKDIHLHAYIYVTQLNAKTSHFVPIPEQQVIDCVQESTRTYPTPEDNKMQSRITLDKTLQQIFRIFDNLPLEPQTIIQVLQSFISHIENFPNLSPQDAIMASKDGIRYLSHLVQLAEPNRSANQNTQFNMTQPIFSNHVQQENMEVQTDTNQLSSNDILTTVNSIDNPSIEEPMNAQKKYEPPSLAKPIKNTIHPRTLKEFSQSGSAPVQCNNSTQREPLHIQVPSADENLLELGMEVVDTNHRNHRSKVVVPDKTTAAGEELINNNNLHCLDFTACHEDYTFDHNTNRLYSKISLAERQNQIKDIRIHMINLYQRASINRRMVQDENLKKCYLAFWFRTLKNGVYIDVSPTYYSGIIQDCTSSTDTKKKEIGNRKRKEISEDNIDIH